MRIALTTDVAVNKLATSASRARNLCRPEHEAQEMPSNSNNMVLQSAQLVFRKYGNLHGVFLKMQVPI
ncbi:hypothetical protein N836_14555 [Leptolyngbya sp. Heron Island J]|nr:hypothetical protein N836_14555 [Leptolyngbya sp. Heron Island J]